MDIPIETKHQAVQKLIDAKQQLTAFGVAKIGLFGSILTGRYTPASDIDVLVEFTPVVTPSWECLFLLKTFWGVRWSL